MTLSTLIKFAGAGNGGTGGGADATSAATAGVATGDILMMIAGIVLAVAGVCAVVFARKYAIAASGTHGQTSSKISAPIIAAFAAILLGLTLSVVGATQMKAHADTSDPLQTSGDIIATVDEQTGDVSFSAVDIKNTSEKPYVIEAFELAAEEGITTIDDVEWNVKIGDMVVYDGVAGDIQIISDHITLNAGETIKLTVSATNLSADLAKSLIDKDVATANSYYEIKYFKVDATVDETTHGSISYAPEGDALSVEYGTAYTVDNDNSKITFGTGNEAKTITFVPQSGYKLSEWQLNGEAAVSGTVTTALSFTAVTASSAPPKSFVSEKNVRYYPVFADNSVPDGFIFYFKNDDETYTEIESVTSMADLTANKDNLYYTNSGGNSITCVSAIAETFNKAFGDDTAKAMDNNKAGNGYQGDFADKDSSGVTCVSLSTDWYCENEDSESAQYNGKYGPGKDFPFATRVSKIEPKVSGVGINAINSAYSIGAYGNYFLSCVTDPSMLADEEYGWDARNTEWGQDFFRASDPGAVLFSRTFN